jgi:hypothetical protein
MRRTAIGVAVFCFAGGGILAQDAGNVVYRAQAGAVTVGAFQKGPVTPVTGAPYSATITNELTETLADGTHIIQKTTGTIARDSEGRTRQDAPLPSIGNLSPANAPHIVFIQDPVAQVSYTLNLTDKTAQRMPMNFAQAAGPNGTPSTPSVVMPQPKAADSAVSGAVLPPLPFPDGPGVMAIQKIVTRDDSTPATTEDLGSQVMEGVTVVGTRTTRVIPTGQIGNDAPISIVTEVWTSPDLKTVVSSKRSDPRMGVQTFDLTNISRTEPDSSLFTVPSDFKVVDGPQPIVFRTNQ